MERTSEQQTGEIKSTKKLLKFLSFFYLLFNSIHDRSIEGSTTCWRTDVIACKRSPAQGCLLAQDIRNRERGGRAQIAIVEGEKEEASPELMKVMNEVLGQRNGPLREAVPDPTVDQSQISNVKLYQ